MIHVWTSTGPRYILVQCSGSDDYMFCPRVFSSPEQAMKFREALNLHSWDIFELVPIPQGACNGKAQEPQEEVHP